LVNLDGAAVSGPLIVDAVGDLFGVGGGGAYDRGAVYEMVKTNKGYAAPTILVSFCALTDCADGADPAAPLIADANGNLFGGTMNGGTPLGDSTGTVFEITDSGFVVAIAFAGTPGMPSCFGKSVSALAQKYGGLSAAAVALGYSDVKALQNAARKFCSG
jgi:hypothetical protein